MSPMNPPAKVTRAETVSKFAARHNEVVAVIIGFLFGTLATLLGVVLG